jgi:hypothetical protein
MTGGGALNTGALTGISAAIAGPANIAINAVPPSKNFFISLPLFLLSHSLLAEGESPLA